MPTPRQTPLSDWSDRSVELSGLLSRAGLGDRAAFATLYERTSAHLLGVVLRIQRDRALAEDILQEVYVNVWRAAQSFDAAQSQPLTWLTSVARNRAIDSLRRAHAQPLLKTNVTTTNDDEETDVYDTGADDAPGPLDLLSRASDARALSRCTADSRQPFSDISARRTHDLTVPSGWRICSATSAWLSPSKNASAILCRCWALKVCMHDDKARASEARLSRSSGPGASLATVSYTSVSSSRVVELIVERNFGWVCVRPRANP